MYGVNTSRLEPRRTHSTHDGVFPVKSGRFNTMTVSGTFSKHDKSLRDTYVGDVVISGTANVVQVP